MQLCQYVVETYLDTAFSDRRISDADRSVIVLSYKCHCFGLFVDWLNNGLKADIQPVLNRLCALRHGMIEEMIDRAEVAAR